MFLWRTSARARFNIGPCTKANIQSFVEHPSSPVLASMVPYGRSKLIYCGRKPVHRTGCRGESAPSTTRRDEAAKQLDDGLSTHQMKWKRHYINMGHKEHIREDVRYVPWWDGDSSVSGLRGNVFHAMRSSGECHQYSEDVAKVLGLWSDMATPMQRKGRKRWETHDMRQNKTRESSVQT